MIDKMIEEMKDYQLYAIKNAIMGIDVAKHCIEIAEKYNSQEFDIDLHETPMHFTKEQKAWIKQFVNKRCEIARQRYQKIYNKAIDDCERELLSHGFIVTQHALEVFHDIAEKLKGGAK